MPSTQHDIVTLHDLIYLKLVLNGTLVLLFTYLCTEGMYNRSVKSGFNLIALLINVPQPKGTLQEL